MAKSKKVIRNISERKRVEHEALEQYRLAETFFNHSVSCLVVLDRDFNFVRVNPAYARACQRDIGEFAGRNHFDLYPSDAKAIFEEVVRSKRPFETFTRAFTFPDQPERGVTYWDWTLVPVLDPQGEVEYLVFSLNDVTERRRAEESLRESEEELRVIFEGTLDGILVADAKTRKLLTANTAICHMLGYTYDEIVFMSVSDLHPKQDLLRVIEQFERLKRGEIQMTTDIPVLRKDGSVAYADIKASRIRLGAKDCLLGVFCDITARKLAEDSARANENRLRLALSNINMAVFHQDRTLRYTWMYHPQLGYLPEQLIGHTDAELLPPEAAHRVTELKQRVIEKGEIVHDEVCVAVNGTTSFYELTAEPLCDAGGAIIGLTGVTLDITERKQTELALTRQRDLYNVLSQTNQVIVRGTSRE